jgi:uncharacterized protein YdaU (DUF1376 family)
MSTPWMPLYVRDYLADTEHLSTLEHGAYLLLIMHYWQRGGLPADHKQLARICRLSVQKWNLCSAEVSKFFDPHWRHKRIDAELKKASEIRHKRSAAGKKSGKVRRKIKRTHVEHMFTQPQSQPPCSTETSIPYVPRKSENGALPECRVIYSETERKTLTYEFAGLDVDAAIAELDRWCDRKGIRDPIDRKNAIYGALRKRHAKAQSVDDMASGPAVTASSQLANSRLTRQNGRANGRRSVLTR